MNYRSFHPPISNVLTNMDDYDVIYVGFPMWWYTAPTIIHTFLTTYNFSRKTIIPFGTSGGSGLGRTVEDLQPLCDDSVQWIPGQVWRKMPTEDKLKTWASSIIK